MKEYRPIKLTKGVDYRAEDLPAGSTISRTWKGRTYTVLVTETPSTANADRHWWRYLYDGQLFKSLSAVARHITGDNTLSGNRFFKLRRRRR